MSISGTTDGSYSSQLIDINPAKPTSFPWLSGIAEKFEQYKFTKLRYEYVSSVSTATAGVVGMAFDPDSVDIKPQSFEQFTSYRIAKQTNVWNSEGIDVPPKSEFCKALFIDAEQDNVDDTDLKTYALGSFIVCTTGTTVATNLGFLFVDYTVELIYPQNEETSGYTPATTRVSYESGTIVPTDLYSSTIKLYGRMRMHIVAGQANALYIGGPGDHGQYYLFVQAVFKGTGFASSGNTIYVRQNTTNNYNSQLTYVNLRDSSNFTLSLTTVGFGNNFLITLNSPTTVTDFEIFVSVVSQSVTGMASPAQLKKQKLVCDEIERQLARFLAVNGSISTPGEQEMKHVVKRLMYEETTSEDSHSEDDDNIPLGPRRPTIKELCTVETDAMVSGL
jgi:hypothetical protein